MLDLGPQLVPLRLEVDLRELRQAAQAQLEDVLGLHLGEVEDLHQAGAGGLRVVALAHDLDDLVDVEDRQQQALDQVQARPALAEAVLGAAPHHGQAVGDEHLQQLLEAHRARLAVHEGDVVDAEGLLQRGVLVQLLEDRVGVEAGLNF